MSVNLKRYIQKGKMINFVLINQEHQRKEEVGRENPCVASSSKNELSQSFLSLPGLESVLCKITQSIALLPLDNNISRH